MINVKPGGILDTVLDQVKPAIKDAAKQIKGDSLEKEKGERKEAAPKNNEQHQKETDEIVKKMYETTEDAGVADQGPAQPSAPTQEQIKSQEELQKIEQLKQQLHQQTYFDPTFNRKPEEKEEVIEEQQKKQEEEQMKLMDEDKKKKEKDQDIAVKREQNKAEQFRGASG